MGMAPVAHVLFNKFMTFNPQSAEWLNRDRFVLSSVYPYDWLLPLSCSQKPNLARYNCLVPDRTMGADDIQLRPNIASH